MKARIDRERTLVFNNRINREKYAEIDQSQKVCPFCQVESLKNVLKTEQDKIWLDNKFQTLDDAYMTVLIESSEHEGDISNLSVAANRSLFKFAFKCWDEMIASQKYRSTIMFKNFGPMSGGTLRHPHLQIVGLDSVDAMGKIVKENFEGLIVQQTAEIEVTLSLLPVMGFVEFNVHLKSQLGLDQLADAVQKIVHYVMSDFARGRCDSYNLFFYEVDGERFCKVVPRYVSSPYFIGYYLPQVNQEKELEQIAIDLMERFKTGGTA